MPKIAARAGVPALGLCLALAACSPIDEAERVDVDEVSSGRLARVHLILQPEADSIGLEPQLDVGARFVHYRGLDDDFVRGRVGLGPLAYERAELGTCVASESLELEGGERPAVGERELVMVDAGNVRIRLGDLALDLPLVLLPDLLPYMAGVEYEQITDFLPTTFVYGDVASLAVDIEGSGDDEIPAITLPSPLPPAPLLESQIGLDPSTVELTWQGGSSTPLVLRLASFVGSEPVGAEVTCVVADRGAFRLDLAELRGLGLGAAGEGLRLSASRFAVQSFEVGEFPAVELVVEVRDSHFVVLP